jgi:hypothetical protein
LGFFCAAHTEIREGWEMKVFSLDLQIEKETEIARFGKEYYVGVADADGRGMVRTD